MSDDIFDFGFTAVSEDDLQVVESSRNQVEELQKEKDELDKRAERLYNAILPLLDNLCKNPEKDYILWPDRQAKIEGFKQHLADILYGVK
jgi:molecular chaperone GrpE (heat shock protein)